MHSPLSIPENMTVSEALARFYEWAPTKYAPRSITAYAFPLRKFQSLYGQLSIGETTLQHVVKFHNLYLSQGYSDASRSHAMQAVRQLFKFLYHQKLVGWDYQAIGVPKCVNNSWRPVTTSDGLRMLAKVKGDGFMALRDRLVISMLYSSGMRNSELCGLRMDEIQWTKGYATIISKKNRKKRLVFWDRTTQDYLMAYMPLRDLVATTDRLLVSCDRKDFGSGITTRTVQRLIAKYRPDKAIKPHGFRHGLGMRLVRSNIHARHIQLILGHKHITSSQIYMDVDDVDIKKAYDKVCEQSGIEKMEEDLRSCGQIRVDRQQERVYS